MPKNTPIRIIDSNKTRAVSFLGGGASAGGTTDHGLLLGLTDDDHAQYLRTDGTRTLTGNMLVSASVTIDGVDISAHAADANAHHAQAHVITGSDHTVTGSTYQIVGLTGTNTIGLLTPASSPGANAVVKTDSSSAVTLVDLTVTSDLFMTGTLDFGTNTIAEDATYLQFAGSKALRFAQNIGNANWTLYNAGGYTTTGSISITGTAGDLDIGTHVLFVDNSQANVGINMAPDPQFALDINGPARATYWIGPHALQIKDAILIAHYDGRQPFNTNFSGEPNGHFGQVATVTGGVIYCAGKFGKALQVAGATTNLFTDPSCEYDANLTQWTDYTSSGTFTSARSTEVVPLYGTYTGKLVCSSSAAALFYQSLSPSAGSCVISAYVRKADKSAVTVSDCQIYFGADKTTTYTAIGDGWYRLVWTGTASGSSTQTGLRVQKSKTLYVDGLMCEQARSVQGPFADGTLGDGHAWTGAAYTSTSTRTAAVLSYTLSAIDYAAPVTIMTWVNLDTAAAANWQYLWYTGSDAYSAYRNGSNGLVVGTVDCGAMPAGWVHVAFVTDGGGTVTAYVNGASKGTASISRGNLTSFYVGGQSGGSQCNGLIDDFAIIGRALDVNEVKSIYNSNAPIFAETSTFSFRPTPKGLIWADDEGLWMKDTAANPVFGIYGGDATKSWAGFTMAPGDLIMGNNAVGSSAIVWDQSAGTFGFYGAGSATAQVVIATDGKLTAGAGKVSLDSTGFHAFNASATATIDIDANGIATADGGARTTIGAWTSGSRIKWYTVGELYAATPETYLDDSSVSRTLYPLVVRAMRTGNDAALIELAAVKSTDGTGAKIIIGDGFRLKDYYGTPYSTNRVVHAIATDIILEATNLQLRSLTTSAAAVGTYSGKIRIQIAGTNYYIPYYAS